MGEIPLPFLNIPPHPCRKDGFLAFQTSRYKLHYYETPTGIKVVMNTDLGVGPIRDVLHHIYSAVSASPLDPAPKASTAMITQSPKTPSLPYTLGFLGTFMSLYTPTSSFSSKGSP